MRDLACPTRPSAVAELAVSVGQPTERDEIAGKVSVIAAPISQPVGETTTPSAARTTFDVRKVAGAGTVLDKAQSNLVKEAGCRVRLEDSDAATARDASPVLIVVVTRLGKHEPRHEDGPDNRYSHS